jgi:hypothetical protein
MTTDTFFGTMLASIIVLFFGFVLAFSGYRFFLILLPIWGFFFGFGFGAQTIQAIFGEGFLTTVTSWVVGFVFAAAFALLSYLFYFFAVALVSGALGYALGVGLMEAIGFDFGFFTWLVGLVAAIAVAAAVLVLNIQKWVIIFSTALLGSGVIVGTFLALFGGLPTSELVQNPVRHALENSWFLTLVFIIIAAIGAAVQYQMSRSWTVESYNRMTDTAAEPASPPPPPPPPAAQPGGVGVTP